MTSPPPPSSDGPKIPPRHRPTLENLTKDSTELDLWAFEEDLDDGVAPAAQAPRGMGEAELPPPRKPWSGKPDPSEQPAGVEPVPNPPPRSERVHINVSKGRFKNQPAGPITGLPKAELDLDDLELWSDGSKEAELEELPGEPVPAAAATAAPQFSGEPPLVGPEEEVPAAVVATELREEAQQAALDAAAEPAESAASAAQGENAEIPSPVAQAQPAVLPLRPRMNLSRAERIGLIALIVLLVALAVAGLALTIGRLPRETVRAGTHDFPIRGEFVTVNSANSYWREPILDGAAPDTVRRGTRLLPVLELDVGGGGGVLRVLFRNEDRVVVGDAVSRSVRGSGRLLIPATAGFEDIGMHAAYRTGQTRPWSIEVLEAGSEETAGRSFKRLFEINISTDRR